MSGCIHGHESERETWAGLEIIQFIDSRGRGHYRYQCDVCGKRSHGIKRTDLMEASHHDLRVVRAPSYRYPNCEVRYCEEEGFHQHHMAPTNVFGEEADWWPTANLCEKHHEEWHDRMNGYDRYQKARSA